MLYTKQTINTLDYSKYKRFVAIGCSFTRWRWASWSDCLAQEMPNATYVNTGRAGAGNAYILMMLQLLSRKYNLGEDTLVGIMWSTFCREDKYIVDLPGRGEGWLTPGNIYTQDVYPIEYVKMCDPYSYSLRDCALISSAMEVLKNAKFDSFSMLGLDIKDQSGYAIQEDVNAPLHDRVLEKFNELTDLYKDINQYQLPTLHDWNGNAWGESHIYPSSHGTFYDYHPKATTYIEYLKHCGFSISYKAARYAQISTDAMNNLTTPLWENDDWAWQGEPLYEDTLTTYQRYFND